MQPIHHQAKFDMHLPEEKKKKIPIPTLGTYLKSQKRSLLSR